jgi:predicted hotdog family 3-hydroxylacyl-ACP dehydratase
MEDIPIESLIPHRNRMKLVEKIVHVDHDRAISEATVHDSWPLCKDSAVSPIILIELVAQTAGICIGWKERVNHNSEFGGKGWIVGVKHAVFHMDEISVNTKIITRSEVDFTRHNYAVFLGTASVDSVSAGEIILQVFRPG